MAYFHFVSLIQQRCLEFLYLLIEVVFILFWSGGPDLNDSPRSMPLVTPLRLDRESWTFVC